MAEAGLKGIGTYVMRRQKTVARYIVTRSILDLFQRSALRPGAWVSWRWWEQELLDLEGAKDIALAELEGEEAQSEDEVMSQEEMTGR